MEENYEKSGYNSIDNSANKASFRSGRSVSIRRDKGFTLVELVVALIILAIIAALVIPALLSYVDSGKEKEAKMNAQKALAATQTALSDIYNDASSRFSPDKRKRVRELAGSTENDGTEFTVWTEAVLRDGYTTAVAENIASYTIKKALYKVNDDLYFYYHDGKWETINDVSKVNISSNEKNNVIYVWPREKQDFAYIPGSGGDEQIISGGDNDGPDIKVVYLHLDPDNAGHVYFVRDGKTESSGKSFVRIVFWKNSDTDTYGCYWYQKADKSELFKENEKDVFKLHFDRGYRFFGWYEGEEKGDTVKYGLNEVSEEEVLLPYDFADMIQRDIFESTEDTFHFTMFIAKIENDQDAVYVDKAAFRSMFINVASAKTVVKYDKTNYADENALRNALYARGYNEDQIVRTDVTEGPFFNPDYKMLSWVDGNTVCWWTDAERAILPADCSGFFASNESETIGLKSFDFSQFTVSKITNMESMFAGTTSLTDVNFGGDFYIDKVTSVKSMFDGCSALTSVDLSNLKLSEETVPVLEHVAFMFRGCTAVPELMFAESFDTSLVDADEGFESMFEGCGAATIEISGFTVSGVKTIKNMFKDCKNIESLDLSEWNMSECKDLTSAFEGCSKLDSLTITGWEVAPTDMAGVFAGCEKLTAVDISGWNLSGANDLSRIFEGDAELSTLTLPEDCALTACTTLDSAFKGCAKLNMSFANVSTTSALTDISNIFYGCTSLVMLDLSEWAADITDIEGAFSNCSNLERIYAKNIFVVEPSCFDKAAFNGCSNKLVGGYSKDENNNYITKWPSTSTLGNMAWIAGTRDENHNDGNGYFTDKDSVISYARIVATGANWTSSGTSKDNNGNNVANFNIHSNKKNITGFTRFTESKNITELLTYLNGKTYKVATDTTFAPSFAANSTDPKYYNRNNVVNDVVQPYQVYFWAEGNTVYWWSDATYVYINEASIQMFREWENIEEIDLQGLDFSLQVNFAAEFQKCYKLGRIIDGSTETDYAIDTTSAAGGNDGKGQYLGMNMMFEDCKSLESLDISKFNTENVTSMRAMFCRAGKLVDESEAGLVLDFAGNPNFKTNNVTTMAFMFYTGDYTSNKPDIVPGGVKVLNLENFSSASLKNAYEMFGALPETAHIEQIIFGEDFTCESLKTTNDSCGIGLMFSGCKKLTELDLHMFKGGNQLTSMKQMFSGCTNLETIDMSGFVGGNVSELTEIFANCTNLKKVDMRSFTGEKMTSFSKLFNGRTNLEEVNFASVNSVLLTDTSSMFENCSSLTTIIMGKDFTCDKVTTMSKMFKNCSSLEELDLYNWDTHTALTNTGDMFNGCSHLKTIYAKDPDDNDGAGFYSSTTSGSDYTSAINNSVNMFYGCNALEGGNEDNPTRFIDKGTTNLIYALVDKPTQEGYFTGGRKPVIAMLRMSNDGGWITSIASGVAKENIIGFRRNTTLTKDEAEAIGTDYHDSDFSDTPVYFWVDNDIVYWWSEADVVYTNTATKGMFNGWSSLATADLQALNFSKQTDLSNCFKGCSALQAITDGSTGTDYAIRTKAATNMSSMFEGCEALEQIDVSKFKTAEVTDMDSMFKGCEALEQIDLDGFDTSSVTTLESMFAGCKALADIDLSGFNTAKVTTMESMFADCEALTSINVSNFNTEKVTTMASMFARSGITSANLGAFSSAALTDVTSMFEDCGGMTTITLGQNFTCTSVTTFAEMFSGCSSLSEVDMQKISTNAATSMAGMFAGCSSLADVMFGSDFKCESVTDMSAMFSGCSSLTILELTMFNTPALTNSSEMFKNCAALTTIWAADPDDFSGKGFYKRTNLTSSNEMFAGCTALVGGNTANPTEYDASHTNADYAFIDKAGQRGYFTGRTAIKTAKTIPLATSWVTELGIAKTNIKYFKKYTNTNITSKEALLSYLTEHNYTKKELSDHNYYDELGRQYEVYFWAEGSDNNRTVYWWSEAEVVYVDTVDAGLSNSVVTAWDKTPYNYGMFSGWKNVVEIDLQKLDFSRVVCFTSMFAYCERLTKIYDGSNGTTNNNYRFDTRAANSMMYMFQNCTALTSLDVSSFTTDSVLNMRNMFRACTGLTELDLTAFNTANVTDMNSMFKGSTNLRTIYVSAPNDESGKGFILNASLKNSSKDYGKQIFWQCDKLKGGYNHGPGKPGSGDLQMDDKYGWAFAHIDEQDNPGYFTAKPTE